MVPEYLGHWSRESGIISSFILKILPGWSHVG